MTNFENVTESALELSCFVAAQIVRACRIYGINLQGKMSVEISDVLEDWLNQEVD